MPDSPAVRHGVVLPAKRLAVAKSRMAALGDDVRRELAAALVLDTVSATLDCDAVAAVLLVTDDIALATAAQELGAWAIPDGRPGDLNETLRQGAAEMCRRDAGLRPVALCGDLPALHGPDLAAVLHAAAAHDKAFVPDHLGEGTTLYAAAIEAFDPRYGPRSRQAHLDDGAVELEAAAGVRQDVDTPEDLHAALQLGVGARTSLVVTLRGLGPRQSRA